MRLPLFDAICIAALIVFCIIPCSAILLDTLVNTTFYTNLGLLP